jgi:hypothetical protein
MFDKIKCFMGFHIWASVKCSDGKSLPYHVKCKRCGKEEYVGP